MTLIISSAFNGVSDPDAAAYIQAVEAADGELLEFAVGKAINDFVLGCKADGIWDAIKASCIMAGARTLAGALVPLVGPAPTNFNFVAGDYNRKTGLVGDGSTKYLDSSRNNNADPQNSKHIAVYSTGAVNTNMIIGTFIIGGGTYIIPSVAFRVNANSSSLPTLSLSNPGILSISRNDISTVTTRTNSGTATFSVASTAPYSGNIGVFGRPNTSYSNARLAFYSIGEALDLALLDARVTTLINAFAAAIP